MKFTRKLPQKAVYWAVSSRDDNNVITYAEGVEISCRWEDNNEKFSNPSGEVVISRAVVYVDQILEVGGLLTKGGLADVPNESDSDFSPTDLSDAYEIRGRGEIPNLRATQFVRKVWL